MTFKITIRHGGKTVFQATGAAPGSINRDEHAKIMYEFERAVNEKAPEFRIWVEADSA